MADFSYTPTPNIANPSAVQAPFAGWLSNAFGSEFAGLYGYPETIHLNRVVSQKIIENFPAQYNLFRLVYSKPIEYKNSDEWSWTEKSWIRPLILTASTASVVAGTTQVIPLTAGGSSMTTINDLVTYPDNTKGNVIGVDLTANTITVSAKTGSTLPAISGTVRLTIGSPIIADGMNDFYHFDRQVTSTFTNYVMRGQRNKRWTRTDLLKYMNSATTDFLEKDTKEQMMFAQQDVFFQFMNGDKGQFKLVTTSGGSQVYPAKSNWGVFPFMKYNGSQHCASSPSTILSDFKTIAFNTNYKNVDVPRFIVGTDKSLDTLSSILKNPIRYNPNDMVFNMNLEEYKIGSMKFVPMSMPLFEQRSQMFPASFENMLMVLDIESIKPVCMKGLEPFMVRDTAHLSKEQGGREDYIDWFIEYNISMEMNNSDGSYWVDLIGI
jgi:hypothetical protein